MREFCLEVNGDYACFTRPEMKVERVSYDIITPSAARAIFEAILWKPAIRWHVTKIEILKPIKWLSLRRNEVGAVASARSNGILIEDARQQRAGYFLREVSYRLHAVLEYIPPENRKSRMSSQETLLRLSDDEAHGDESEAKYHAMFERRASKGQYFHQPYLGCREFACDFRLVREPYNELKPIEETRDLGWMLYDLDFSEPDKPRPMFFRARLDNGVLIVPAITSDEVRS